MKGLTSIALPVPAPTRPVPLALDHGAQACSVWFMPARRSARRSLRAKSAPDDEPADPAERFGDRVRLRHDRAVAVGLEAVVPLDGSAEWFGASERELGGRSHRLVLFQLPSRGGVILQTEVGVSAGLTGRFAK